MERAIENVPLADYPKFFAAKVLNDRDQRDAQRRPDPAALQRAGGDHLAPHRQARDPAAIAWCREARPTHFKRQALWALTELPGAGSLREPATGR